MKEAVPATDVTAGTESIAVNWDFSHHCPLDNYGPGDKAKYSTTKKKCRLSKSKILSSLKV
jgi:hypothetical protein